MTIDFFYSQLIFKKMKYSEKNEFINSCRANQWTGFYVIWTSVMKELKKGEGVQLINFTGGPGVPLLNFAGAPRVPLKTLGGFRVPLLNIERGSRDPGPTFTPCHRLRNKTCLF